MVTKLFNLNENNIDFKKINEAAEIIKNGGLVVFPTETVYGLGADTFNDEAVKNIYKVKGRPSDNPLIIHTIDLAHIKKIAQTNEMVEHLVNTFMPNAFTLILNSKELKTAKTIGVRIPKNKIAHELIKASGGYISAPSANISGRPSGTSFNDIKNDLDGFVDVIIDAGNSSIGIESTILDLTDLSNIKILRHGSISIEAIQNELKKFNLKLQEDCLEEVIVPKAPGMKYKHYAPNAKSILLKGSINNFILKELHNKNIGFFCYKETFDKIFKTPTFEGQVVCLGSNSNIKDVAKNLYSNLRKFDDKEIDLIYIEDLQPSLNMTNEENSYFIAVQEKINKAVESNFKKVL